MHLLELVNVLLLKQTTHHITTVNALLGLHLGPNGRYSGTDRNAFLKLRRKRRQVIPIGAN